MVKGFVPSGDGAASRAAAAETGKSESFGGRIAVEFYEGRISPHAGDRSCVVELYVGNMDEGHARVKMDEVKRHIDRTWFAWVGGADSAGLYYYRIHSPVILIEFDHQRPANLARFARDPTCRRASTFTAWCALPTATIMGRTCSASTTSRTRTPKRVEVQSCLLGPPWTELRTVCKASKPQPLLQRSGGRRI